MRQSFQWTFTPRNLMGIGSDRNSNKKVECSLCVCIALGGHRRTTSPSSDGSGEAGSEQGWSVVDPQESIQATSPTSQREKTPGSLQHLRGFIGCRTIRVMVRETVPSQQLLCHSKTVDKDNSVQST